MDVSVSDTPVGRLLDGRYRVEAQVARGGMATVYRALDTRLDRAVALKVMHPELAVDSEFVVRFISEARAAARLSHPNVVGVFDQGEDDGTVYLAMEYVEGQTLRQVLRERGPLTPAQASELIEPVLSALAAAHQAGLVHRDVKPENVLVGEKGRVKVADFGLARALTDRTNNTRGLLLGTVAYISPEQALGDSASPRSDVYAAGIMLYEMLTGAPPHTGPTDFVVVRSHIERDVPPPSAATPSIPPSFDEVVRRATTREPQDRYADAEQFAEALSVARGTLGAPVPPGLEARESAGVSVTEAMPVARPADQTAHTTMIPPTARPRTRPEPGGRRTRRAGPPRRNRRRARWAGGLLLTLGLVLAAGVVAGAWWLGEGRYATTPALLDLTVAEAEERAAEEGLRVRQGPTEPSERVEAGRVLRTEPGPGERLLRGNAIVLVTSAGPERTAVPDLRGMTAEEAEEVLAERNLVPEADERYHDQVEEGHVIDQADPPGTELRPDDHVLFYVSMGREPIEITDFTGQDATQAHEALSEAGFEVVTHERPHPDVRPGTVISQDPNGGTGYRGDEIALLVAVQPDKLEMPDVRGMPAAEAERMLREAGFTEIEIDERRRFFGEPVVVDQRPRPGREVDYDRKIRLRVR